MLRHPVGNKRLGVTIRMNTIILHPLGFQINLFHKKWQQRNIKLFGELWINRAKGFIITATVVCRQTNLHQQRFGICRFDILQNRAQGLFGLRRRKAAQAIVTAKFDQHPARLVLLE